MTEVQELITARFEKLSGQQRRAARFILEHQGDVALLSMRQLAIQAGLPPVTFVRLARALGFEDYLSFRALFQELIRSGAANRRWTLRARELQRRRGGGDAPDLVRDAFTTDMENLRQTFERNDPATMLAAVRALEHAERLLVLGQRSCLPAAYLFYYVARLFRPDTLLVRGNSGTLADDLRGVGKGDVLLAVSIEPYTTEVVRAIRYAKAGGACLVALTDTPLSPIARSSDCVLLAASATPSFFHSVTALTALVQSLLALLVTRGGKRAISAIEASERQLDQFGAYWHENGQS
jgi:DNA-binding MurR/RpiR family transcriptional regulator